MQVISQLNTGATAIACPCFSLNHECPVGLPLAGEISAPPPKKNGGGGERGEKDGEKGKGAGLDRLRGY